MAAIDAILKEGRPGDWHLRVSAQQREFLAFALWVVVTFMQFKRDELLLYPLALYFGVRVWQDREAILGLVALSWPIMLFPVWCMISLIWAVDPSTVLKQTVYLFLTMMICYHVVLHLTARHIMYAVLIATGFAGVLNFAYGLSTGRMNMGLFTHKNMLGTNMVVLWITGLATFLDRGSRVYFRVVGLGLGLLGLFLVLSSRSATALLLSIGCGTVAFAGALAFQGHILRKSRLALIFLVGALLAAAASNFIATYHGDPFGELLETVGKDRTMTGRTVLWDYAVKQIREEPWLGVGAGGFWRYYESPLVQRIYEEFYKWPTDNFNFHNSFLEVAVHQGLVGLGLVVVACIWGAIWNLRGALALGTMPFVFFFAMSIAVLIRTMAEADFYKPFVLFHMIFWIGALAAFRTERYAAKRITV